MAKRRKQPDPARVWVDDAFSRWVAHRDTSDTEPATKRDWLENEMRRLIRDDEELAVKVMVWLYAHQGLR